MNLGITLYFHNNRKQTKKDNIYHFEKNGWIKSNKDINRQISPLL